ncbi:histidine--tRNA ligase [Desulfofustis limnaeus]|jgi:histidyl-tRNA synthetase|uniref:histidine--tRNA ligase n=1 Tax=Desulfofustis limnaeus TaxID=2740163 RepID=UPI00338F1B10
MSFRIGGTSLKVQALLGFRDILPAEIAVWRHVEQVARDLLERFHFAEIRLPILEKTELFARSIGAETDIVEKEMYTFVDRQETLRPEATASLIRAYVEHNMHLAKPVQRLYTMGPMFRRERPQKGRLRQFHQLSVEVVGSSSPHLDAELLTLAATFLAELGITASLEINSLGCPECRPAYRNALLAFINERLDRLCDDCRRRSVTNPLRVLDCKKTACRAEVQDAPSIQDHLCSSCAAHLDGVQQDLQLLAIDYRLNKFMVRGLDYYVRTTFEFVSDDLGAQSAVLAGGRYDGLVEMLGGPAMPGIGFAVGLERLVLLLQQQGETSSSAPEIDIFLAALGEAAVGYCVGLQHRLRGDGFRVDMDYAGKSLKSQMKQADKARAAHVLIVGDQELNSGQAVLRNMETKQQAELSLDHTIIGSAIKTS